MKWKNKKGFTTIMITIAGVITTSMAIIVSKIINTARGNKAIKNMIDKWEEIPPVNKQANDDETLLDPPAPPASSSNGSSLDTQIKSQQASDHKRELEDWQAVLKPALNNNGSSWLHWNDDKSRTISTISYPPLRKNLSVKGDSKTMVNGSNGRDSRLLLEALGLTVDEVPDDLLLPGDVHKINNTDTELTRAMEHSLKFYVDLILRMRCESMDRVHDLEQEITTMEWLDELYERLKDKLDTHPNGFVTSSSKVGRKITFILHGSHEPSNYILHKPNIERVARAKLSKCACVLEDLDGYYTFVDREDNTEEHSAVIMRVIDNKHPRYQAMVRLEVPRSRQ